MGTNYYLHQNVCGHCGRSDEPVHIGKSSGGWCFSLHVIPPEINDLNDWEELFSRPFAIIKDEYGKTISAAEMLSVIKDRGGREPWDEARKKAPLGYESWSEFHRMNYSCEGPNGLLRHVGCEGHWASPGATKLGPGTWDLCEYEFS